MTRTAAKREWILLVHLLPPKPTGLRVGVWRKLQRLGAVAVKNSVYVLPYGDKTHEDFQWLKQEIEADGGEATVFRASSVEGAADAQIVAAFRRARDAEYALVVSDLDRLARAARGTKDGRPSAQRPPERESELDRLHKEMGRIMAIDFFPSAGRSTAVTAYARCRKALAGRGMVTALPVPAGTLDRERFQGRLWVTRQHVFIDRLATIWLIKRFIDRRPRFAFVAEGESVTNGISFDMYGGEFSHHGEDCTFETMLKCFGLRDDRALGRLAEIVHDIDLKDSKFNCLEAVGLSAVVRGLCEGLDDDRRRVARCLPVFDGLYQLLGSEATSAGEASDGKGRAATRARRKHRRRK
jgi:hypothetical protein